MLVRVLNVLRCIWRGAWRPTFTFPPQPRWYHYVEYWSRRPRDIIAGALLFLLPPWVAYFIYEKYSVNPRVTLVFTALMAALWILSVVACYYAGRKHTHLDNKRHPPFRG